METKDIFKKYAKGDIDAPLKVISLGMGVQSTALYLMSSMGYKVPRADVVHFAPIEFCDFKISFNIFLSLFLL